MKLQQGNQILKLRQTLVTLIAPRWPIAILPGLHLLFFHKMAFSNLILARGDVFLYFYPYWQAASEALRNGRIPLWNPHLFMGAPMLANSQVGFFYPLNWPVWLLFSAPVAVKASILLHLLIAGLGAYLAARRTLNLSGEAALLTAVLFSLSGYLTAQVEHVNQVQGLAWLPWYFVVLAVFTFQKTATGLATIGRAALSFALLNSLQLLAGHTQTLFISGVAVLLWTLFNTWKIRGSKGKAAAFFSMAASPLLALFLAAIMALLLSAVQLLPTLELTQLSSRQGGLSVNEVLSFSLHPLLLAQALLPTYNQSLFSEYEAFFPMTALLLAGLGAWRWRNQPGVLPAIALVVIGLLLAIGVFNPLNWLLARLPFFNLFRAPARWLVLYAFGVAILAGVGWQNVRALPPNTAGLRNDSAHRPLRLAFFLLVALIIWSMLAQFLTPWLPTGPEAPYEAPNRLTLMLWALELLFALIWFSARGLGFLPVSKKQISAHLWPGKMANYVYLAVGTAVLFFASRTHPYHNLTTPAAYFDLRPAAARLLVTDCDLQEMQISPDFFPDCALPSGKSRFLSLSDIFFDPGDQGEIAAVYGDQLSAAALFDYTVAVKQKEIIAPNLSLVYGLDAVDGFDGGILPLNSYSELMTLILPDGKATTDGRLREQLTAVPEQRWLNLFHAKHLITDKTKDQWRQGVFFDLQHPRYLAPGEQTEVGHLPNFSASAIWLLASQAPQVTVESGGNQFTAQAALFSHGDPPLYRIELAETAVPRRISLLALAEPVYIAGLALVNEAEGTFATLIPGPYRLIHSGDVKIYENLDVLPRAFFVGQWEWQPDSTASLAAMRRPEFLPGKVAVLQGTGESGKVAGIPGSAEIMLQEPERVVVHTRSETEALLLLTDAIYPGWQVAVDGQRVDLYTANVLFRGLFVPAGEHEVVFTFTPRSFTLGRLLSIVGLGVWLAAALVFWLGRKFQIH